MYEKRYHDSIGVSDLYKMKDVVNISEDQSGLWSGTVLSLYLVCLENMNTNSEI